MNQTEKIVAGCCALAAVLCFLPWFSVSFTDGNSPFVGMQGSFGSVNAFDRGEGVVAFLFLVAAGGLLFADKSGMLPWDRKTVLLAPVAACAGAAVCMLIYFSQTSGDIPEMFAAQMSMGRTVWFWLALIAVVAATWFAFKRWQEGVADEGAEPPGQEAE